jgi:Effector-associated domain 11
VFHYTRDKSVIEKPNRKIADLIEGPSLSEAQKNSFILLKSRLAALETEKDEGTLESAAYTARLNELKKAFLNLLDDME